MMSELYSLRCFGRGGVTQNHCRNLATQKLDFLSLLGIFSVILAVLGKRIDGSPSSTFTHFYWYDFQTPHDYKCQMTRTLIRFVFRLIKSLNRICWLVARTGATSGKIKAPSDIVRWQQRQTVPFFRNTFNSVSSRLYKIRLIMPSRNEASRNSLLRTFHNTPAKKDPASSSGRWHAIKVLWISLTSPPHTLFNAWKHNEREKNTSISSLSSDHVRLILSLLRSEV